MKAEGKAVLRRVSRSGLLVVACLGSFGCWEQVSREWFAQMKEQPAVQALEGRRPFDPPAGTVPFGGIEARIEGGIPAASPEAMALKNPIPSTPESINRGKEEFNIYCAACHGQNGLAVPAEVPVAAQFQAAGMPVLPLTASPGYSDGYLFTKIRYGKPGMPGYPQIPPTDRWHIVNYLRTLFPIKKAS